MRGLCPLQSPAGSVGLKAEVSAFNPPSLLFTTTPSFLSRSKPPTPVGTTNRNPPSGVPISSTSFRYPPFGPLKVFFSNPKAEASAFGALWAIGYPNS